MGPKANEDFQDRLIWFVGKLGIPFSKIGHSDITDILFFDKQKNTWLFFAEVRTEHLEQFKKWME